MNYTGYPAQSTPGVSAPQYGVTPNYPPSTTFPNQNFQQGYNGMYNQTGGQMPPYQNQPPAAQSMMGMPMPWGYGQGAVTGMHPGGPNGNGWNPQQFSNNGYGNQVANGGNPMTQQQQQQHANKRDHTSAFGKPHSTAPRVPAPPAVPSFGNPLPSKPPPPSETTRAPKKKKRQHNQLGLTPKTEDHESSEEEEGVDEESKFAAQSDGPGGISAPLKFTYRGRTATLQTPEDIAKWIEERKKRFPTQARVEEKKKAMEEAKKAREEALKQKRESRKEETKRTHKDSRGSDQQKAPNDPVDAATKAAQKAEKLRQKLLREQKRVAKAEAEAKRAQAKVEALQKESAGEKTGEGSTDAAEISSPADMSGDSDWTSSSGSDDSSSGSDSDSEGSDDDSAPEEMTSRREGPERVPPPPRENVKKRICRHFARNGRCLRGDSCNFLHELPDRKTKNKPAAPQKGRQGLLQMVCFVLSQALLGFS